MTHIIRWPKHIRFRCPPEKDACAEGRCMICSGGLFSCTTCGLSEGELTTDCPGERVGPWMAERCLNGQLDYTRADGWVQRLGVRRQ